MKKQKKKRRQKKKRKTNYTPAHSKPEINGGKQKVNIHRPKRKNHCDGPYSGWSMSDVRNQGRESKD